jgi:hypothetical protein
VVRKCIRFLTSSTRPSAGVAVVLVKRSGGRRKAARHLGEGAALRVIS